jgi:hypothetical protein
MQSIPHLRMQILNPNYAANFTNSSGAGAMTRVPLALAINVMNQDLAT